MTTKQLTTFYADDRYFGIEVTQVQEVLRYQEMTRAPLAQQEIRGLINLRGQIVVALDLRRRLGLPERERDRLPMNVVVRSDDTPVSLLVDEIGDVLEVDEELFEPPPETLQSGREYVRGAYKLDGRLLLELDMERVLAITSG
jgi:purine-binding chemotaxis protein CheW